MAQLIPENTTRRLDSLGRVTLPSGLRRRLYMDQECDLELFTAIIDGRQCVVLSKVQSEEDEKAAALEVLKKYGYEVE